jgi:HAMP domain-containing protein
MTFMWKFTIVLIMTSLLTDIISVAIIAALPKSLATDLIVSLGVSAAIAGIIGVVAGGAVGRSLRDLQDVVSRFVKWDLSVTVPHVERSDEIGEIAKGLEVFKADAIRWSESYSKEQDTQVQGRLAAQHRTAELIRKFRDSIAGHP